MGWAGSTYSYIIQILLPTSFVKLEQNLIHVKINTYIYMWLLTGPHPCILYS